MSSLVRSDRVEVSLHGHSLVRCMLSVESWELLWELRTSIQTMLYRNLKDPNNAIANTAQDGKLISLLVELLNNTDSNLSAENHSKEDWPHLALLCVRACVCVNLLAGTEIQKMKIPFKIREFEINYYIVYVAKSNGLDFGPWFYSQELFILPHLDKENLALELGTYEWSKSLKIWLKFENSFINFR